MLQFDLDQFAQRFRDELVRRYETTQAAVTDFIESGQLMREIYTVARDLIIKRTTEQHVDMFGKPFKKYTDRYAWWKGYYYDYHGKPNLCLTGWMLEDISLLIVSPLCGYLTFFTKRSFDIARYHQEGDPPLPKRAFFGIRDGTVEAMRLREDVMYEFSKFLISRGFR